MLKVLSSGAKCGTKSLWRTIDALLPLGVRRGLLSPLALGVAGFDLLSGMLALDYLRRIS